MSWLDLAAVVLAIVGAFWLGYVMGGVDELKRWSK